VSWIKNAFSKFSKHYGAGGIRYAVYRGFLYFLFLIRSIRHAMVGSWEESLCKGRTRVVFSQAGIHVFYDGHAVTGGTGLFSAVLSSGTWFNLEQGKWKLLEKNKGLLSMSMRSSRLPIEQIWTIGLEDDQVVSWRITVNVFSAVRIEEICAGCLLPAEYKTWICNYSESDFPAFTGQWQDLFVRNIPVSQLGVRLLSRKKVLPSVLMELEDTDDTVFPLIRNSPSRDSLRLIGVRITRFRSSTEVPEGTYSIFSGKIGLYNDDMIVDNKIKRLRRRGVDAEMEFLKNKKEKSVHRVLLANLPWQRGERWGVRAGSRWPHIKAEEENDYLPFPFFLAYAAALLRDNGYEAVLIDALADEITEDEFMEKVVSGKFDFLVAETSIPSFEDDMRLLRRIAACKIAVILCGPNSDIYQPSFLEKDSFISFVMCGEYEFILLDLLRSIGDNAGLADVRGLIYRRSDGKVCKNPSRVPADIDLLPWPERAGLPMQKYLDAPGGMRTPSAQIIASRGCPFRCQFCLWPQVMYQGRHYRSRNFLDVVDEMEFLVKDKKFASIYFDDDTFNIGRERMLNLCREIRRRGLHKTQWAIMARPDLMDEELLDNFKKAGLYAVKYGVESAAQHLVDNIGKGMDLKKTEKMIRYTKKLGIKVHLTFAFGLPGESRATIEQTIAWVMKLDPFSVQFSIVTPFPGTDYYRILDQKGWLVSRDLSSYDGQHSSVIRTEYLGSEDLEIAKSYAQRVWQDHQRGKRGFSGDLRRFFSFVRSYGISFACEKTVRYLAFILFRRKQYLKFGALIGSPLSWYGNKVKENPRIERDPLEFLQTQDVGNADIFLIQCPPWDVCMPPLGISYLSGYLQKIGYKTKIFDLNIFLYNLVNENSCFLWQQKSFDWWVNEDLFRDTWDRVRGLTENFVDRIMAESHATCIGLSVNFAAIRFARELIRLIRARNPSLKIIVGGWGGNDSYMRGQFGDSLPDAFVVGEGENVIGEVLEFLSGKRKSGECVSLARTEEKVPVFECRSPIIDLDNIPWPKFEDFHLGLYRYSIIPLFSSRGCIGRCTFCNDWRFSKPYRSHSARYIFEEIKYHVQHSGVTIFSFKDLLCNGNIKQLNDLCDLLIASKMKISWDSQAIARPEMTYSFLCKMRKSGCTSLVYGAESFSDNVLKRMGKLFTRETIAAVLRDTHRAGIIPMVNIILGFPGETEEDFRQTMNFVEEHRKYIRGMGAISVCLVNGGAELDLEREKYGIVLSEDGQIRAKQWVAKDGSNTYEIRKLRAEKFVGLVKQLGISYDTCTL
jgi:radical SAM superfamily enzyme YgiQ (UPF0313 family)